MEVVVFSIPSNLDDRLRAHRRKDKKMERVKYKRQFVVFAENEAVFGANTVNPQAFNADIAGGQTALAG